MGVGTVLDQVIDGTPRHLSFFRRKLNSTKRNYSTFNQSLLAVHLAVQHIHHILEGLHFTINTDHQPSCTLSPGSRMSGLPDNVISWPYRSTVASFTMSPAKESSCGCPIPNRDQHSLHLPWLATLWWILNEKNQMHPHTGSPSQIYNGMMSFTTR